MHFLYPRSPPALVQPPIDRSRHCQRTAKNGRDASEEAGQCCESELAVDDFHGEDVVGEDHAGDIASVSPRGLVFRYIRRSRQQKRERRGE